MQIPNLDKIVTKTLITIEQSRNQIFDIIENTRSETERIRNELEQIQKEVLQTIKKVDNLECLEKAARQRLLEVSREFERYTEEDVRQAYDKASELQVELGTLREREKQLKLRRSELERSLRRLEHTVDKAEGLITQIGVVFDYLEGNMKSINEQLEVVLHRRQLAPKIIQTQEEERRRIAREIHDGPAQSMANVVLRTEVCEKLLELNPAEVRQELGELKSAVRKSLQEVRRIIFDLRPMGLDDLGLFPVISRYVETLKERYSELEIECDFRGQQQRFDSIIEVALYRVVQEALQNVLKHAKAKQVKVLLENDGQRLMARIIDNGQGFVVEEHLQKPKSESYGLVGMKERMEILGGQLYLNSKQGEGTEVLAIVPLEL